MGKPGYFNDDDEEEDENKKKKPAPEPTEDDPDEVGAILSLLVAPRQPNLHPHGIVNDGRPGASVRARSYVRRVIQPRQVSVLKLWPVRPLLLHESHPSSVNSVPGRRFP